MLHKKQKFTFSQARFVYQDKMGRSQTEKPQDKGKEAGPDLNKLYMDVQERGKLYGKASFVLEQAKNVKEPSKELADKRAELETKLTDARARDIAEKNFDVFAHEAVAIHKFVERIEAIMAPPKPVEAAADKTKTEVARVAPVQPTEKPVVTTKPAPAPTQAPVKKPADAVATKPAGTETGSKLFYSKPADRQKVYGSTRETVTAVVNSQNADVKKYADLLSKLLLTTEALDASTDKVGVITNSKILDLAQKAVRALAEGKALTAADKAALKDLETTAGQQPAAPKAVPAPAPSASLAGFGERKEAAPKGLDISIGKGGGSVAPGQAGRGLAGIAGTGKSAVEGVVQGPAVVAAPKMDVTEDKKDEYAEEKIPQTFLRDPDLFKKYELFTKDRDTSKYKVDSQKQTITYEFDWSDGNHYRFVKKMKSTAEDREANKVTINVPDVYRTKVRPKKAA